MRQQKEIDAIFERFDKNRSGQLERSQLLALLADVGEEVGVAPGHDDVDFVLHKCDTDHSGTVRLNLVFMTFILGLKG